MPYQGPLMEFGMQRRDDELYGLCLNTVRGMGFELVTVEDTVENGRRTFRFFIDHARGVVVDDCASVSRELDHLLDAEFDFEGAYVLEVSSPGLEHKLRHEREYAYFAGSRARLVLREPVDGRGVIEGTIASAGSGEIRITTENGQEFTVRLADVVRARLLA